MSLRDIFIGRRQLKGPASDRLFAITTAYVTLQAEHGIESDGAAAIVFQALANGDFEASVKETEEVVRATCGESGTTVATEDDTYGYRWMVLRSPAGSPNVEDLAVGLNAVASSIEGAGFGERLLAAVFAFRDGRGTKVYLIYNYKRGHWYPFVPAPGDKQHSVERELQLKAQIGDELPLEPELERWFPLWGIPI